MPIVYLWPAMPIPLVKVWHMGELGVCQRCSRVVIGCLTSGWKMCTSTSTKSIATHWSLPRACHVDWLFANVLAADVAH